MSNESKEIFLKACREGDVERINQLYNEYNDGGYFVNCMRYETISRGFMEALQAKKPHVIGYVLDMESQNAIDYVISEDFIQIMAHAFQMSHSDEDIQFLWDRIDEYEWWGDDAKGNSLVRALFDNQIKYAIFLFERGCFRIQRDVEVWKYDDLDMRSVYHEEGACEHTKVLDVRNCADKSYDRDAQDYSYHNLLDQPILQMFLILHYLKNYSDLSAQNEIRTHLSKLLKMDRTILDKMLELIFVNPKAEVYEIEDGQKCRLLKHLLDLELSENPEDVRYVWESCLSNFINMHNAATNHEVKKAALYNALLLGNALVAKYPGFIEDERLFYAFRKLFSDEIQKKVEVLSTLETFAKDFPEEFLQIIKDATHYLRERNVINAGLFFDLYSECAERQILRLKTQLAETAKIAASVQAGPMEPETKKVRSSPFWEITTPSNEVAGERQKQGLDP